MPSLYGTIECARLELNLMVTKISDLVIRHQTDFATRFLIISALSWIGNNRLGDMKEHDLHEY